MSWRIQRVNIRVWEQTALSSAIIQTTRNPLEALLEQLESEGYTVFGIYPAATTPSEFTVIARRPGVVEMAVVEEKEDDELRPERTDQASSE